MGELLTTPDGRWLGDFSTVHTVPADSTKFSLQYPVGWTNGSWYELNGCNLHHGGCSCSDCCATYSSILYEQRSPGDTIDPCWTASTLDGFAVSITPQQCKDGCGNCLGAGLCCCTTPCDTVRCGAKCGGDQQPAGWPLVNFGLINPSTDIRRVTDTSGPAGTGTYAMRIDFSGAGAEGAAYVGEGGGHDEARPPFHNSSDPPPSDWLKNYRSATGITINAGDCLRFSCYVKAVPDRFGHTCTGYPFQAAIQNISISGVTQFDEITLDGSWQLLDGTIDFDPAIYTHPLVNPMLVLLTRFANTTDAPEHCPGEPLASDVVKPRGRVHVKAAHLSPCKPQPVHVWRWH